MNGTPVPAKEMTPNSRNQRLLLGALFCISVADGIITRFIISEGLGSEGNSWLSQLASSDALIAVKIIATLLAIFLLWRLHYRRPKLVLGVTIVMVCWYTLVVFWNISIVLMGLR